MRADTRAVAWRLAGFFAVSLLFMGALIAVFGQARFQKESEYQAEFSNVSGLEEGQFVRIAGVEVGKVTSISLRRDNTLLVRFTVEESVVMTQGTKAVIRYDDLIGGRYVALEEGAGDVTVLPPGGTIPLAQTSPALDLDALIGGFRPLFRALDPEQVNALSGQLISAFEGQGETINSFFEQAAALTSVLADRDQLIGELVVNLEHVLGALGDRSTEFARAVDSLAGLVSTLAQHGDDLSIAVRDANAGAKSIADLLARTQQPLDKVLHETDRTAGIVVADHDYVDNLLATLPDAYQILARQGLYGDYFGYYLCEIIFKFNGKGGEPVYVKVAGQSSGRCAPR